MTARQRLPNRRASETFSFLCNDLKYLATVSRFADGRLAEIFIDNAKAGSHSDSRPRMPQWSAALRCNTACRST